MRYDLDCRLLEGLDGTRDAVLHLCATLAAMREDHGISRFCLSHPFDASRTSVNEERLRCQRLEDAIKAEASSGIRIKVFSALLLQSGASDAPDLQKLTRICSGYLPLRLPLLPDADMTDRALNALLYQRKLKLLFLSFDEVISLYPAEFVQKLLRIRSAAFSISYRSFARKEVQAAVKQLLSVGSPVLFGSGLRTSQRLADLGYAALDTMLQEKLSVSERERLQAAARAFWSA